MSLISFPFLSQLSDVYPTGCLSQLMWTGCPTVFWLAVPLYVSCPMVKCSTVYRLAVPLLSSLFHCQLFHCMMTVCPIVFVDVLSHFQQSVPLYMLTGCLTVYIICLSYYVICLSLCLNKLHIPPFTHNCCICICLPTLPHKMLLSEQFPSHSNSAVCHTVYPTQPSVPPAEQLTPMSVSC